MLGIMQVILRTAARSNNEASLTKALMQGYPVSFWMMFGLMISSAFIRGFGLHKAGKPQVANSIVKAI